MAVLESLLPLLAPKPAATPTTSLAQIADYGTTTPPVSDPNQGDPTVAYGSKSFDTMSDRELGREVDNRANFGAITAMSPFSDEQYVHAVVDSIERARQQLAVQAR